MTVDWRLMPIRELYEGLYDGPHATPKPASAGPIFLGIKNVTEDGHLDFSEVRHIAEEDFARWTKRVEPRPGDLVFTYEATLNRYALIPSGFRGCLGRRMALIRPDLRKANPKYLYYYFFAPEWRAVVRSNTLPGATVDRLPLTRFPDFPVRIPLDRREQDRIVEILSAYDDLIENCERRIRVLDEMARALYREWFVLFRYPGHQETPLELSELGPVPRGWKLGRIGDVCSSVAYGYTAKASPEKTGPLFLRITDIVPFLIDWSRVPRCELGEAQLARFQLQPGDIVVARSGSVGFAKRLHALRETAVFASYLVRVRINPQLASNVALGILLQSADYRSFVTRHAGGVAQPNAAAPVLISMPVPIPPREVSQRFDELAEPLLAAVDLLATRVAVLRRTRDLLLPRLLSGKIPLEAADPANGDLAATV